MNPVFEETLLTIACSDLMKKQELLGKIHLNVLEILIFTFSDVTICRLTT